MQRRGFLEASGAGIATLGFGSLLNVDESAGSGFAAVDTPVGDTLTDVAQTADGPIAVGVDGQVLHRGVDGWSVVEDAGLAGEGNTLTAATSTDRGGAVWLCGNSGVIGFYDPTTDRFRDYSDPNGETADWTDIAVSGRTFDVTIIVGDASGNVVVGEYEPESGMSWNEPTQPTGGSITGVERCGYERYRVVDADGRLAESTDNGESWSELGAPETSGGFADLSAVSRRNTSAVGPGVVVDYDPWAPKDDRWEVHELGDVTLHDVDRESEDDGIAVGAAGTVVERTDESWIRRGFDTKKTLRAIATADDDAFPDVVVGADGTVLERGSYTALPHGIDLQYSGNERLRYQLTVDGRAEAGWAADRAEQVEHDDGVATIEGTIDDEGGELRDTFAYAGELTDIELFEGDIEHLHLYARGEYSVRPAQFAATKWTTPSTSISATLHGVAGSAAGPVAVGNDGYVIARRDGSWRTVTESGPAGADSTLRTAASTEEGEAVWFAGDSGSLGRYDPETGEITDHSAPRGITDSLTALTVGGDATETLLLLATGSGQFLRGRFESDDLTWREPSTPASGAAIVGIQDVATPITQSGWTVCDTNGDVTTTRDWGETWETESIPGLDGTPRAFGTRDVGEPTVVCDDGSVAMYDHETWTTRKLDTDTLYAVGGTRDRFLTAGASGTVQSDRLSGWQAVFESQAAIHDIAAFTGRNETVVAVGENGVVHEQRLQNEPYP